MRYRMMFIFLFLLVASGADAQYVKRNLYLNGTIFEDVTDGSGFDHIGHGKCISLADFDMDGDLDIYISAVYTENRFFQNEGNLRFKDITSIIRLGGGNYDTHGIVWADFDNNGYLDVFVANNLEALSQQRGEVLHPNVFFRGGDEGFIECAFKSGLAGNTFNYSCGVTTADVNGDGLLDLYVSEGGYRKGPECANSLYVNNGDGTYRDIAAQAGVAHEGNGYCCSFSDYDNDGDPDLYVGNINDTSDPVTFVLYRNNGDGTFADVTEELGLSRSGNNISCFWGDIDTDGDQDLFLGCSSGPGHPEEKWGANVLFRNNGNGTFTDISKEAGIDIVTNSRGTTMGDIDNDGDLDIIVTNSWYDALVFINDGKGKFTESHEKTGGSWFYGHGLALGDLDNDGDLDLVGGNWRRPSASNPGKWFLFRNKTDNTHFIKINVKGTKSNRSAVMSKVWVYDAGKTKDNRSLRGFREVIAGSGTFPGNPLQIHFGLDATKKYDIVVKFPSGIERILENVGTGKTYDIYETDVDPAQYERVRRY
ncbi:MAG TPA: CRTAC1 family protein [Anaerolineae bacterium]|nr:CRTAC1 family protein [Anaerolineae bacterium]